MKPKTSASAEPHINIQPPGATQRRRLWLLRVLAAGLIPALVFGILEVGLRVAGYGYPTAFFRKTQINGERAYVENDQFAHRFFPPGAARTPSPTVLAAKKGTNEYRIFILGESAALGDPEPAFGFGRYLEVLLRERFPGTEFEVVCTAVTAINSHALLPLARECAEHDGNLWIVYMGHNEVVGPFGGGTVLGPRVPGMFTIRASLAAKRTRVGQLLASVTERLVTSKSQPRAWGGMQMFLEAQTRPSEPGRQRANEHFRKNLEAILMAARRAGVPVVLSTVASNLKDCAPFGSMHSAKLTEAERQRWEQLHHQGAELEATGKLHEAVELYRRAAEIDDEFAELQFRLGRCQLGLGDVEAARRSFELARDFDALAFRADSRVNGIIAETARKYAGAGVLFLDADRALANASGILGNKLFHEHVHLNFEGNYLLARAIAEQVAEVLPAAILGKDTRNWATQESCERRLGVTPWDRLRVYQNVIQRRAQPPFTLQLDEAQATHLLSNKIAQVRAQLTPEARKQARALYQEAIKSRAGDFHLHSNFAKFLEDTGDNAAALQEWTRVQELLPYHFGPSFYLGKLQMRMGKAAEAEASLKRTLRLRADVVEAMDMLGQLLGKQKRTEEALKYFGRALGLQPGNARLHLHRAEALAVADRRDEAIGALRLAIELRPDFWEARYFLGVELATREQIQAAEEQFREVVRLKPDYALAHLNLGVALVKQRRMQEAMEQFRQTLKLDPSNRAAQEYLLKLESVVQPVTR